MIYYIIAASFPLICWGINDWAKKAYNLKDEKAEKLKVIMTLIAILPMFLLFVLRNKSMGTDTFGYVRAFQYSIPKHSFQELLRGDYGDTEVGYLIYVKVITLFTNNYTIFFLINGIIIFGALLHFAFRYTENPFVFFFLFIALGTYAFINTGLRQSLAIAICIFAFDFVRNRKLIPFLLLVLLAYFFHKSAMVFLLIYPLGSIKQTDWMIFTYVILAVVFVAGFAAFQGLFNEILGYEYEIEETGNGGIFMIFVFVLCSFSIFMLFDKKEEKEKKDSDALLMQLSLMAVVFWLLRLISRTAERISFYYIIGLYAYFSRAIGIEKDKLSNLCKWLLILASFVLYVYRNVGAQYIFFWQ